MVSDRAGRGNKGEPGSDLGNKRFRVSGNKSHVWKYQTGATGESKGGKNE